MEGVETNWNLFGSERGVGETPTYPVAHRAVYSLNSYDIVRHPWKHGNTEKDEFQFNCPWEEVPQLRANIDGCVKKAGEHLRMECPLSSDSMMGATWYHTH